MSVKGMFMVFTARILATQIHKLGQTVNCWYYVEVLKRLEGKCQE
jgi:hypothetical protein